MKKSFLTSLLLLFTASQALLGQDFSVQLKSGNKLFFSVSDTLAKTVEISKVKTLVELAPTAVTGNLDIPSTVVYKDVTYQVASIADRVFSGASELKHVSIPSSVTKIGSYAFENCTSLEGVVLPAGEPKLGKGVFDGCTAIRSVSIGSDWQTVDCSLFASSSCLESLFIPARVKKITNLKQLSTLNSIIVDSNNSFFSSKENLLYTKDGKTLLACPVSKTGIISLPEGTEIIFEGAFNGCENIIEISLPQTVHDFSYITFIQCTNLSTIKLFAEVPPVTARWNGSAVFAIRIPNSSTTLEVPASVYNLYLLSIFNKPGEYETMKGEHKQVLTEDGFMSKESIRKIKNSR